MTELSLGFSPCPNDTFIFHALTHGLVESPGFVVREVLADVETLNRWASEGRLELTKTSYHAYGHVRDRYVALRAGGALGEGVGPILVTRDATRRNRGNGGQGTDSRTHDGGRLGLRGARVATPGRWTTAHLLFQLFVDDSVEFAEMPYDRVVTAVASGEVDAGLVIHEARFTYAQRGLARLLDLGELWETETGLPVPLGAVLIRRDLAALATAVDAAIKASIAHARAFPDASSSYVRRHAAELDPDVVAAHIGLYVTEYSVDVGGRGEEAVAELFSRAEKRGLVPAGPDDLFAPGAGPRT